MDFMTVKEASVLWNMDVSTIGKLLRRGNIPGSTRLGGHWVIPRDTPKPPDGRRRDGKEAKKTDPFRFPLYVNFPEDSFVPALSEEEKLLRKAQLDFFACSFEPAERVFSELADSTSNVYVQIISLFFLCVISTHGRSGTDFPTFYSRLNMALVQDFPHKREMELVIPWLYAYLAEYKESSDRMKYIPDYTYSPDCATLIAMLSFLHMSYMDTTQFSDVSLDIYELQCKQAEQNGYFYEAQEMHLMLFMIYNLLVNKEYTLYHLRRGLDLALEHELILVAACYACFYPREYNAVLAEYPEEFSDKIRCCGKNILESMSRFTARVDGVNIFESLSKEDFQLAFYATMRYSNQQVARFMNKSQKTVANRYHKIYKKLKITRKKELVALMRAVL